mgnify:CR=1 FL=1
MSDSGDDDEIIGSIAGGSTTTYNQIRVEMESGESVVTEFYLNQRLSTEHKLPPSVGSRSRD